MPTDLTPEKLRDLADWWGRADPSSGEAYRAAGAMASTLRTLADEREAQAAGEAEIREALARWIASYGDRVAGSGAGRDGLWPEHLPDADAILALPAIRAGLDRPEPPAVNGRAKRGVSVTFTAAHLNRLEELLKAATDARTAFEAHPSSRGYSVALATDSDLKKALLEAAPALFTAMGQAEFRLAEERAHADRLAEALRQGEACNTIVEPRSDTREYRRILDVMRVALSAHDARRKASDGA